MPHRPTRRQLLQLTGTAAVAGVAGCASLGAQSGEGDDEDSPDNTEEASADDNHEEENGEEHHDGENGEEHHEEGEDEHQEEGEDEHHEEGEDEHGHNHDEGIPDGPSHTAEVVLETAGQEHHFKPHVVWIEAGGTVTWRLESGSHDAAAYHPDNDRPLRMPEEADPWSTELLSEEGRTAEHTFETEGVYDYYCTPHESVGMVGTVIVGEPDPHEQPALEEPQSSLPEGARTELKDLADNVNEALGHAH
ncbi:MAG: plastocyanin/azurin family copper-binding protein [Halovenus sp.]